MFGFLGLNNFGKLGGGSSYGLKKLMDVFSTAPVYSNGHWGFKGAGLIEPTDLNIICVGNSITLGTFGSPTTPSYPTILQTYLGSGCTVVNLGVNSKTGTAILAGLDAEVLPSFSETKKNYVIYFENLNDLGAGKTVTQVYNNIRDIGLWCKSKGATVIVGTANLVNHAVETNNVAVNALILDNYKTFAHGYIDLHSIPEWQVPATYTSDGVHPKDYYPLANLALQTLSGLEGIYNAIITNNTVANFQGTDDCFRTDNAITLADTNKLTIGFWFKSSQTSTFVGLEIGTNYSVTGDILCAFNSNNPTGSKINFWVKSATGSNQVYYNTNVCDGKWHYIQLVINRDATANPQLTLFVDFVSVGVQDTTYQEVVSSNLANLKLHLASRNNASVFGAMQITDLLIVKNAVYTDLRYTSLTGLTIVDRWPLNHRNGVKGYGYINANNGTMTGITESTFWAETCDYNEPVNLTKGVTVYYDSVNDKYINVSGNNDLTISGYTKEAYYAPGSGAIKSLLNKYDFPFTDQAVLPYGKYNFAGLDALVSISKLRIIKTLTAIQRLIIKN